MAISSTVKSLCARVKGADYGQPSPAVSHLWPVPRPVPIEVFP
jgi:hypothetical protein